MTSVNHKTIRILAIESSCDETAAAVIHVTSRKYSRQACNMKHVTNLKIISNVVSSQVKLHAAYGGVYPELASREHVHNIIPVIQESLNNIAEIPNPKSQIPNKYQSSNNQFLNKSEIENLKSKIDCIAVTTGPGLIGSLLVGVNTAKTLAYTLNKPIYAINHLEGHIYSCFAGTNSNSQVTNPKQIPNLNIQNSKLIHNSSFIIHNSPKFPILALIVSGGHTSLVYIKNHFDYKVIGETLDDAAGEVFDKVARMLDIGYPGGPAVAKMAMKRKTQNEKLKTKSKILNHKSKISFPRPMINSNNFDFSFSGLKTAVLYTWQKIKIKNEKLKTKSEILNLKSEICREFQEAVVETLVTKTLRAAQKYKVKSILLCGGVSANSRLRQEFELALGCHPVFDSAHSNHTQGVPSILRDEVAQTRGEQQRRISSNRDSSLDVQNDKPRFFVPEKSLTGDNAAMIGIAAAYRIALGKKPTPWYDVNADSNLKLG